MSRSTTVAAASQNLRALERANDVRRERAELKRRVRVGRLTAAEVILDAPWQVRTMEVGELLMSQSRWGQIRCRRLLLPLQVSENKRIGTLTERQRQKLAALLGARSAAGGS
jgi:hypothetical protein